MKTLPPETSPIRAPLGLGDSLQTICDQVHPDCFVCAPKNPLGLHLAFVHRGPFQVEARWRCNEFLQGYPGQLHGGIIATLIDAAMVHALMTEGIRAVTANLSVRYVAPVSLDREIVLSAERRNVRSHLHHMVATIEQGGVIRATGRARFFDKEGSIWEAGRGAVLR